MVMHEAAGARRSSGYGAPEDPVFEYQDRERRSSTQSNLLLDTLPYRTWKRQVFLGLVMLWQGQSLTKSSTLAAFVAYLLAISFTLSVFLAGLFWNPEATDDQGFDLGTLDLAYIYLVQGPLLIFLTTCKQLQPRVLLYSICQGQAAAWLQVPMDKSALGLMSNAVLIAAGLKWSGQAMFSVLWQTGTWMVVSLTVDALLHVALELPKMVYSREVNASCCQRNSCTFLCMLSRPLLTLVLRLPSSLLSQANLGVGTALPLLYMYLKAETSSGSDGCPHIGVLGVVLSTVSTFLLSLCEEQQRYLSRELKAAKQVLCDVLPRHMARKLLHKAVAKGTMYSSMSQLLAQSYQQNSVALRAFFSDERKGPRPLNGSTSEESDSWPCSHNQEPPHMDPLQDHPSSHEAEDTVDGFASYLSDTPDGSSSFRHSFRRRTPSMRISEQTSAYVHMLNQMNLKMADASSRHGAPLSVDMLADSVSGLVDQLKSRVVVLLSPVLQQLGRLKPPTLPEETEEAVDEVASIESDQDVSQLPTGSPVKPPMREILPSTKEPPSNPSVGVSKRRLSYAEVHGSVTILFADIVGFTKIAHEVHPLQVMQTLNDLYCRLDNLCLKMPVYKVETIGDCYMAATNLMHQDPNHANTMIEFAMAVCGEASKVMTPSGQPLQLRIGIHTGTVMGGIIGLLRQRYCLFGDTVNTASRMESTGIPGAIHVSEATYNLLKVRNLPEDFKWIPRGKIPIKGKGSMATFLLYKESELSPPPEVFMEEST